MLCMQCACSDPYIYDNKEPDNLGSSIYDYLKEDGNFTYFLRLIDDLEYAEVLSKTGSKTLFPADDAAFGEFFKSNPYGATSYELLTPAQKRIIMNSSMVDMAYLSDMLPNVSNTSGNDTGGTGLALRRFTSSSYLDSISRCDNQELPATQYWSRFADKNLFMIEQAPMMVHFTGEMMATKGVTNADFRMLYDVDYASGDIYINGIKVVKKDIICKNGYIHVLEKVALPSTTMAQEIEGNKDTKIFAQLLEKFSAPFYDASVDAAVKEFYDGSTPLRPTIPGLSATDSIFVKRYFNEQTANAGPLGESLASYGMLYYDPNNPSYSTSSSQQDMGSMFVPTDKAMMDYFNGPDGGYLRDSYGSWDNVPTDIVATFLKNHQKRSFFASLPHLWTTLTDETSYPIAITAADVVKTIMTNNGVVYVINKVLPPIDYKGVYASTLTADNTTIMKWAITDDWTDLGDSQAMRYYMYLRSMENMYNLLVPTDEALSEYRDPISWGLGGDAREIWSFAFNPARNTVTADVYRTDEYGQKGEYKRTVNDKSVIRNRLRDILDSHIVVGSNDGGVLSGYINESNAHYFLTKGGATIMTKGSGTNFSINGGGDAELGLDYASVVTTEDGRLCQYDSQNGRTFFISHVLHDPSMNVYQVLGAHPEFSSFFTLCKGNDVVAEQLSKEKDFEEIFSKKVSTATQTSAIGLVVNSFNNFRYSIFVPTNEAIEEAFKNDKNLYTWEEIAMDMDMESKKAKALYLLKFLRYHFVDNSAYVSGATYGPLNYETGARNKYDKFHKVSIQSNGSNLTVRDERGSTANVLTSSSCYNLMARDMIVNNSDNTKATQISSSSRAVIHLIDRTLNYDNE